MISHLNYDNGILEPLSDEASMMARASQCMTHSIADDYDGKKV